MNYKFLSKYHYIYRLTIGPDHIAHVEKIPIAYSNKHFIYIIEPGNDELVKVTLNPQWQYAHSEVRELTEEDNQKVINNLIGHVDRYGNLPYGRAFYYILDDPEPLQEFAKKLTKIDFRKNFLLSEKRKFEIRINNCRKDLDEYQFAWGTIVKELEEMEKQNDQT